MKKIVLWISVLVIFSVNMSCAKPDYKKIADNFIKTSSQVKDYTIKGVEDTTSPKWKAIIVYIKQGRASMPNVLFVSSDGKSVVAGPMVFVDNKPIFTKKLEPELGKLDFKLSGQDRFVYNPSGAKTVYMFTDPDCPYCQKAQQVLQTYKGEYRVVVKYFPLENIHPGATKKAIAEQAEWLKKNGKLNSAAEAKRMVEEDIAEAGKAEISGVPTYVMEDGTLKQGLF